MILACSGIARSAQAQEVWQWDLVIRGTAPTDIWRAPAFPQVALVDRLYYPSDMTENPVTGELLIADSYNARVVRFNELTGAYIGAIPTGIAGNSFPYGISVDANGNILVTDQGTSQVVTFDKVGNPIGTVWNFGSNPVPVFHQPWSIAVTTGAFLGDGVPGSEILISDNQNSRVLVFGTDGVLKRSFGTFGTTSSGLPAHGQFDRPTNIKLRAVAGKIDPTTGALFTYPYQVYLADYGNDRVQVMKPDGTWLSQIVGLSGVQGVAVDPNDRVLIADTYHNRIAVFSQYPAFAPVNTIIGSPSLGTNDDQIMCDPGAPTAADRLNGDLRLFGQSQSGAILDTNQCAPGVLQGPTNIALDQFGHLLVIDNANWRFERFVQPAMTSTATASVAANSIVVKVVAATGGNVTYTPVSVISVTPTCRDASNTVISCSGVLTASAPTITPLSTSVVPGAPQTFTITYGTQTGVSNVGVTYVVTIGDGIVAHNATSLPSDPVCVGCAANTLHSVATVTGTAGSNGWWVTTPPTISVVETTGTGTLIQWAWGGDNVTPPAPAALNACPLPGPCTPVVLSEQKAYLWFRSQNFGNTEAWQQTLVNYEQNAPLLNVPPVSTAWFKADVVTNYAIVPSISQLATILPSPGTDPLTGATLYQMTASGEGTNILAPTVATGKSIVITDNAGLQVTLNTYGPFRIDKHAPVIGLGVTLNKAANATTGWFNIGTGAPTITFTATDNLSGFPAAQATTGVDGSLNGKLAMVAAESSNSGATAAATSFSDLAGWNAVIAAGTPALSCNTGLASCAVPAGAAISSAGGALAVSGLKVDLTLPTFSVGAPVNALTGLAFGGQNGWLDLSSVAATVGATFNVTASDLIGSTALAGSGVKTVCYNLTATGTTCTAATLTGGVYPVTVLAAGLTNGTIWVIDNAGNQTAAVPFTVKINRFAPVFTAATLSRTTAEDTALTSTVAATDGDADTLTYTFPATTANGTLTNVNTATGAYTYTPNLNFNGADTFVISVTDGKSANPTTATLTITVTAVNDAPVAQNASLSTNEATALAIPVRTNYVTDVDTPLTSITLAIVTAPTAAMGAAVVSGGTITFTPAANFNGTATFTYRANDGALNSNTATITINVIGVNNAPVATNGAFTTNEDVPLTMTVLGTLVTDVDTATSGLSVIITQAPVNGTLTVNGASVVYTPNADFNGTDSFKFKGNDGLLDSNIATVTLTINPVNDAPSFVKGANIVVNEDAGPQTVTGWATTISAGPANESTQILNFIVTNSNSALFSAQPTVSATGVLTFTAAANASGAATVTVQIHDNGGVANGGVETSVAQTFTITVNAVNDAPVANNLAITVVLGQSVSGQVLATDVDSPVLTYSILAPPATGTVTAFNPLTGAFTYTSSATNASADSFLVSVSDGLLSSTATVSVTVTSTTAKAYTTYTQGGWGAVPSGSNPGALLAAKFATVYTGGFVQIGGNKTAKFTSASAIETFLPQGGRAGVFSSNLVNPATTAAGVFAGQVLALRLSVDFSNAGITKAGLGSLKVVSGKLAGYTVNQVLALANTVIGGTTSALPSGVSITDLNTIVDAINRNFDNGATNNGFLQ